MAGAMSSVAAIEICHDRINGAWSLVQLGGLRFRYRGLCSILGVML